MKLFDTSGANQSMLFVRGGFYIDTVQCTIIDTDGERNTVFSITTPSHCINVSIRKFYLNLCFGKNFFHSQGGL